MCGFAGFLGGTTFGASGSDLAILKRMSAAIRHRGPDDDGRWLDENSRIGLGHRRLSIVDLSPAGHQPMHSASGRYVIAFNGEIYNHLALRAQLDAGGLASGWRGQSDTETLLAACDAWGVRASVERAVGMFAFALWDRETRTLTLGRDRLGEKPLYYGWQGRGEKAVFLFGSELKALRAHPAFEGTIDRGALSLLLRHNCVPAPYSIYEGIAKLQPGTLLAVSLRQPEPRMETYWSGAQVAVAGTEDLVSGSAEHIIDRLETLLKDAVGGQMMADVPLGAFLSGGVDSSTIVALMQAQSSRPIKTFSIGFHEAGYNEAEEAKAVAVHLGTDHTELYVTAKQAMAVIPKLPALYDEPFSDSSQIPTFLVSELARHHVTVALSGDGGDELFCGYNRYQMTAKFWRVMNRVPLSVRRFAGRRLAGASPDSWESVLQILRPVLPLSLRFSNISDKIQKGAAVLECESVDRLYQSLTSHWQDPSSVVIGGLEPPTRLTGMAPPMGGMAHIERMMALDMLTYLPDDILVKVDRAAMAVSLETRVPFLDHRVVEFAWRLPQSMKLRGGQTKWALRQVLYRHVPSALIDRPKMGFGVPIDRWLRGPLRDWAEPLLSKARLESEGYFHADPVRRKWQEHLSGKRNWQYPLWDILMFQLWLEHQGSALDEPALRQAIAV